MSKRNLSQAEKGKIRKEIREEIEQALRISTTRGSVVTSRGDLLKFRIERISTSTFIHIGGYILSSAKDAAAAGMLALGYTRY